MNRTLPIRAAVLGVVAAIASLAVLAGPASATPAPDSVQLLGVNADFGDNTWTGTAPTGSGTLSYDVSSGTTITPHLVGYLHLNAAKGMNARMQLRYFDVFGNVLATKAGGTVTPLDNDHHVYSVDLAPYSNPAIYRVNVSTTYDGGSAGWQTITARNYYV